MAPRSFDTVSDLLQNTINLSTTSQSEADGELAWLRKRLENERRELRSRSVKHEARAKDGASRHARTVAQQTFADSGVQGGKENTPHSTSPGTRLHEVCFALDMHVSRAVWPGSFQVVSRKGSTRKRSPFSQLRFCFTCFKKNMNAPRPSEHPPVRGKAQPQGFYCRADLKGGRILGLGLGVIYNTVEGCHIGASLDLFFFVPISTA